MNERAKDREETGARMMGTAGSLRGWRDPAECEAVNGPCSSALQLLLC
jgi:hypothetical protein